MMKKQTCNICGEKVRDVEDSHICGVPICESCGEEHLKQIQKEIEG